MKRTERELKVCIEDKASEIAKILYKGLDCELRTSLNGVTIIAVKKDVISK